MDVKIRFWPLLLISGWSAAQGMLAPPVVTESSAAVRAPLLISQRVPETLTVTDSHGTQRPLLSYKAPLEVLVVFFLSPACPPEKLADFHIFYNKFKEWHVAFVAVSTENNDALAALLKKAGLEDIPAISDTSRQVTRLLNPPGTPWVVVLDEDANLRYRGPLQLPDIKISAKPANERVDTYQAMDDIIGHVKPVVNPEPGGTPQCPLTQ